MNRSKTTEPDEVSPLLYPKVRIDVRDFGPVAEGSVELRPLTVFVGPSNTGKTYLAILIYALHRVFGGFPRLPLPHGFSLGAWGLGRGRPGFSFSWRELEDLVSEEDLQRIFNKLNTQDRISRFSDLSEILRSAMESNLKDQGAFAAELRAELQRCFDLESVPEMIRLPRGDNARISLRMREEGSNLWRFDMDTYSDKIDVRGRIEDLILLNQGGMIKHSAPLLERWLRQLGSLKGLARRHQQYMIIREMLELVTEPGGTARIGDACYLPAVRGGIMQSHRVIASTLIGRSTRAGFEHLPSIPTFSGGVADFMQRLILYDEDKERSKLMAEIAESMEKETLSGRILTTRSATGGYPEFVYRSRETKQDIRLTRASSMVSELAPVVLFLRGIVAPGDTFIIEEPEAHLHPAAQTRMAITLARLVRAGVRVVVTTHSDWLLQEIANLMREGELRKHAEEIENGTPLPSWLRREEVGIWLFQHGPSEQGSKVVEIPFDESGGVEPDDYEEVAEALYNRSAELQNRLTEAAGGSRHEQE